METEDGVFEYNETFQDFSPEDSLRPMDYRTEQPEAPAFKPLTNMAGYSLNHPWHFMHGYIRDKYMRKAPITKAVVFEYDILFALTNGLGVFKGSERRRFLEPLSFGPESQHINELVYMDGKMWVLASRPKDAITRFNPDFSNWEYIIPGYNQGFPNGNIKDMCFWQGYYWFASEDGVIRMDVNGNSFKTFGFYEGVKDKALSLCVHQGKLYAGSKRGLSVLSESDGQFMAIPKKGILNLPIYGLSSGKEYLWVSTRYGLYGLRKDAWDQPRKIELTQGLKVWDALEYQGKLYYTMDDKLYLQKGNKPAQELLRRPGLRKIKVQKGNVWAVFSEGAVVYNPSNDLSLDFFLNDGIIGSRVKALALDERFIWVATDEGISRIDGFKYIP